MESFVEVLVEQMQGLPVALLCLVTLGGGALVFAASAVYGRLRGAAVPLHRKLLAWLLLFYTCFLLMITLFNREAGSRTGVFTQLISFIRAGGSIDWRQLIYAVLNIILFVPLGILLALLWEKDAALKRVVVATVCCFIGSFAIEALQLATSRGYFELEDIVMNMFGGLLGATLASVLLHFLNRRGDTI